MQADTYFCVADEQEGFPRTREALRSYTDTALTRAYLDANRDSFGALFGHNARKFGNLVVDELTARAIHEIPNIFGPIMVRSFQRGC